MVVVVLLGAGCGEDSSPAARSPSPTQVLETPAPTPTDTPAPLRLDLGVSYDAVYFPFDITREKIEGDLDSLKQNGVNSIYVTTSEEDAADPTKIDLILEAGHARGLRVYLNAYIGGTFSGDEGESADQYLLQHPEDEMTSRLGAKSGLPTLNSQVYRAYLKDLLKTFLNRNFDGVLLDEPFFPQGSAEDYYPFDEASQVKFNQMFGEAMPEVENDQVIRFRKIVMQEFLTELLDFIKGTRPEATTILVVLPDFGGRDFIGTDDWRSLSRIDSLDVFQIDPYWYERDWEWFVANVDNLERETSGSKSLHGAWVQAYGMTGDYERISQSLQYLKDQGIPWLAAWVTDVRPNDDMEATWRAIAEVYLQAGAQQTE